MTRRRATFLAVTLAVMAAFFAAAYWLGYRTTMRQIAERGETGITLATERLTLELDQFRYLPAVLARNETIRATLSDPAAIQDGNLTLQRIADISGALDIYVIAANGDTIAASNWNLARNFIGQNYAWRPYFQRAVRGGLGLYHAVGSVSGQRGFYFAHPILGEDRSVAGVVTVKVDLERIETQWRADPQNLFFSDDDDVIFLANRPALVLHKLSDGPLNDPARYVGRNITTLPGISSTMSQGYEQWRNTELPGLPETALFLSKPAPTVGMTAHSLIDLQPARAQALLWGGLAATIGGLMALMTAILIQRRAALATQLAIEERARNQLEDKVVERTAALARVQAELVQAGKLSALGEMSAGISHELNQPLAAIQSFAENANVLIDRGDMHKVRANLAEISQVSERMARIIRNFRTFAHKDDEEIVDVNLTQVINEAINLTRTKLETAGVQLNWTPPEEPMTVRGGSVRLQQVVVNLISNAVDAMQDSPAKQIDITLNSRPDTLIMTVRDTGPGLETPEKVFDPFYTTKTVGEGLGLGLSISYGIVKSFGGNITGENREGGGAQFIVELARPKR